MTDSQIKRHITQFDSNRHMATVATPTGCCSCCCCCCCLATISSSTVSMIGMAQRQKIRQLNPSSPAAATRISFIVKILLAVVATAVVFALELNLILFGIFVIPIFEAYLGLIVLAIVLSVIINRRMKKRLVAKLQQTYQANAYQS